jgi:hypothetical protein
MTMCAATALGAAPVMNTTTITPTTAYTNTTTLTGYCNATDTDMDNLTYYWKWYKNGTLLSEGMDTHHVFQETGEPPEYYYPDSRFSPNPGSYIYDENYLTMAYCVSGQDYCYIKINYTKPQGAINATWTGTVSSSTFCGYYTKQEQSVNVPQQCFDYPDKIRLRMSSDSKGTCSDQHTRWYCYNTSNHLIQVHTSEYRNWIYEESINWTVQTHYESGKTKNIANISGLIHTKSDNYTFNCLANDGTANSSWLNHTIIISNSAPEISSLQILPNGAQIDQDLYFSNFTTDLDNDTITDSVIFWYRNGSRLSALDNSSIVLSGNTSLGDTWVVNVSVFDGTNWSAYSASPTLTIGDNTSPSLSGDELSDTSGINDEPFSIYINASEANTLAWVKVEVTDPNGGSTNFSMFPGTTSGLQSRSYIPGTDGIYTFAFYAQDGSGNSRRYDSALEYVETTSTGSPGGGGGGGSDGASEEEVEEIIEDKLKGHVFYAYPGDVIKVKWLPVKEVYEKEVVVTAVDGDVTAMAWFSPEIEQFFSAEICDLYTLQCSDETVIKKGDQAYVHIKGVFESETFQQQFLENNGIEGTMEVLSNGARGPHQYNITVSKHYLFDTSTDWTNRINAFLGSDYDQKTIFNATYILLGSVLIIAAFLFAMITGII